MVQVIFTYDEAARKWEAIVTGVDSELEAQQAFNAVVITCFDVQVGLFHKVEREQYGNGYGFKIIPAV